jgi:O-antigen ligase
MITATAFMLAFTTGCLFALIRHPIFGLVTYVGLLYVPPHTYWWNYALPSLRWSLVAAAFTLIGVLIHRSKISGPRLFDNSIMRGFLVFVIWLVVQSFWALNKTMHLELLTIIAKYTLLIGLIYKCIDSTRHLKYFLWTHATGCFYLGIIVLYEYLGGRFEGFQAPGIDEANAAALHIVTGILVTFVLFLSGKWIEKAVAIGFMPITLNALVATISRSGFLALGVAGLLFNLFTPKKITGLVRILSIVGLALFLAITNPIYWERMSTIIKAGEEIEGVDTGSGRLVIMEAQFEMFADYPLGCGHRCTVVLSPAYLDDTYLTGSGERRGRASHNTFMSLLVEQGIPGAVLYVMLLLWTVRAIFRLRDRMQSSIGLLPITYTATVATLGAITVGDMFVDYLKFEARVWFLALLIVLERLEYADRAHKIGEVPGPHN